MALGDVRQRRPSTFPGNLVLEPAGLTTRAIEELAYERIGDDQACGRMPMRGLLAVAKRRGMHATTLDLRNSGDTSGKRDWVVGYGAWAID